MFKLALNRPLAHLLPLEEQLAYADGDRLISTTGKVFYNFVNESIRWLCGYDNQTINLDIDNEIAVVQEYPNQLNSLYKQLQQVLCMNAGRAYKDVVFTTENTFIALNKQLKKAENQFFLMPDSSLPVPEELKDEVLTIEQLIGESDAKDKTTEEGWSLRKLKALFKQHKKEICALVLSPLLISKGTFLSHETCHYLVKMAQKYHIPVIWDDSFTCFFRTGYFYSFTYYEITPDFVTINSDSGQNAATHLLIPTRKNKKKYLKSYNGLSPIECASSLIILHSLLLYIADNNLVQVIEQSSMRLIKKLQALSLNLKNRFGIKTFGLITFIDFNSKPLLAKVVNFLSENNFIVFNNQEDSLLLLPQLTISSRAIDLFIQTLDDFFKSGIRIKSSQTMENNKSDS